MGRILCAGFVACMAIGLVAAPARAGEEDYKAKYEKLEQEVQNLKETMLEQDINAYLAETDSLKGVQGGDGLRGVSIHADFTSMFISTVGADPSDVGVVSGSVNLNFDLQVNDNITLFIYMTANNNVQGTLPASFPITGITGFGGATLSGLLDFIGVDGTVPTNPGSVTTNEAGIRVTTPLSNGELHWEMGELDPRNRFLQNAFAGNNYTQFVNNEFNDPSSVPWLTDASGRTSLGWHFWIEFGNNKQHTINFGWFNTPGEYFKNGQFMIQYSWKGEVKGRAMNVRLMGWYSEFPAFQGTGDEESAGGGFSWDWMVTDKIGVFAMGAINNENDAVPTTFDFSLGGVLHGVGSRADDQLGVAIGFIDPSDEFFGISADLEFTIEVYYMYSAEDGKLQITPFLQFVSNPGGGTDTGIFADDTLFLLGVRIHVPF